MKSLKSLVFAAGVAIVLCASQAAHASWDDLGFGIVDVAVDHIDNELTQLAGMACVKAEDVKAIHVETFLRAEELADLRARLKNDDTQREIAALRHALSNLKVLDGRTITPLKDLLSGDDFDIDNVIGVVVASGRVLILGYGERR